jgi:serine/threonine protein kinase
MAAFEAERTVPSDVRNFAGGRLSAGQIIDDRYEIIDFLGTGGMCDVYNARQTQLDKTVALKLLQKRRLTDEKALERFRREAVVISTLDHPNIVKVFGFGVWEGQPYLAMEYLQGESLAHVLKSEIRLGRTRALHIFDQILQALEHAHERGIVHRDLKPSNVMLLEGDFVKLVDFGIAKMLPECGKDIQKLTQTEDIFGTLLYISPEQCLGRPVDARSDIYSMGCLMYETLTGGPPLTAETPFALIHKQLSEPTPTSAWLDQSLSGPVLQCMAKDPEKRPQSSAALRQLLSKCAKAPASPPPVRDEKPAHEPVKRRHILVPICIGASVALAFAVWLLYGEANKAATETTSKISNSKAAGQDNYGLKLERAAALENKNPAAARKLYEEILATNDRVNFELRMQALDGLVRLASVRADNAAVISYRQQFFEQVQHYAPTAVEWQMRANTMMLENAHARGDMIDKQRWITKQLDLLSPHAKDRDLSDDGKIHLARALQEQAGLKDFRGELTVAEACYQSAINVFDHPDPNSYSMQRYLLANDQLIDFYFRHNRAAEARALIQRMLPERISYVKRDPELVYCWAMQYRKLNDHPMAFKAINAAIDEASVPECNPAFRATLLRFRADECRYAGGSVEDAFKDRMEAQAITDKRRTP